MGYSVQKKVKFKDLPTTKTGDVGEAIVQAYLHRQYWHIYPHAADQAAPVDIVAIKPKDGGFDIIAVEVKTYPRRFAYDQTGIDSADYWTYREIIKTLPLTILFVDPFEACVYALPFHKVHDRVVFDRTKCYFDLADCQRVLSLTADELRRINWQPTPHYKDVQKFFL
jgi:hypothetical protein